jgi:hypothetical protein
MRDGNSHLATVVVICSFRLFLLRISFDALVALIEKVRAFAVVSTRARRLSGLLARLLLSARREFAAFGPAWPVISLFEGVVAVCALFAMTYRARDCPGSTKCAASSRNTQNRPCDMRVLRHPITPRTVNAYDSHAETAKSASRMHTRVRLTNTSPTSS